MGSYAVLKVGRLTLDETKYGFSREYLFLFQPPSLTLSRVMLDGDDQSSETASIPVLKRTLSEVRERLEMLGYSMSRVESFVNTILADEASDDHDTAEPLPSCRDFTDVIIGLNADDLRDGESERLIYYVPYAVAHEFKARFAESDRLEHIRTAVQRLGALALLRLLSEHPKNADAIVELDLSELVLDELVTVDELSLDLPLERRFLLVTEGSSDARILSKAFQLRRPNIGDFFYYVDVSERYPFSGTGNLYNFCRGLVAIKILNRTIVIYDNDAAGRLSYEENRRITLPTNIAVMKLPDLPHDNILATLGPHGKAPMDINGSAAAIECYLDLNSAGVEPVIRWKSYERRLDEYQGELEQKQLYEEHFLAINESDVYDFSKIELCLDGVISVAAAMAERLLAEPEPMSSD